MFFAVREGREENGKNIDDENDERRRADTEEWRKDVTHETRLFQRCQEMIALTLEEEGIAFLPILQLFGGEECNVQSETRWGELGSGRTERNP